MIPADDFTDWLPGMNVTEGPERSFWHVTILNEDGKFILRRKKGYDQIDLTTYLLPGQP